MIYFANPQIKYSQICNMKFRYYVYNIKVPSTNTKTKPESKLANNPFGKSILPDIPDFYADRMRLTVTVFGVNISFGMGNPHPDQNNPENVLDVLENVRIRMSLEHAKVMAMILKKQIQEYERQNETQVAIPKQIIEALQLKDEKW